MPCWVSGQGSTVVTTQPLTLYLGFQQILDMALPDQDHMVVWQEEAGLDGVVSTETRSSVVMLIGTGCFCLWPIEGPYLNRSSLRSCLAQRGRKLKVELVERQQRRRGGSPKGLSTSTLT